MLPKWDLDLTPRLTAVFSLTYIYNFHRTLWKHYRYLWWYDAVWAPLVDKLPELSFCHYMKNPGRLILRNNQLKFIWNSLLWQISITGQLTISPDQMSKYRFQLQNFTYSSHNWNWNPARYTNKWNWTIFFLMGKVELLLLLCQTEIFKQMYLKPPAEPESTFTRTTIA